MDPFESWVLWRTSCLPVHLERGHHLKRRESIRSSHTHLLRQMSRRNSCFVNRLWQKMSCFSTFVVWFSGGNLYAGACCVFGKLSCGHFVGGVGVGGNFACVMRWVALVVPVSASASMGLV